LFVVVWFVGLVGLVGGELLFVFVGLFFVGGGSGGGGGMCFWSGQHTPTGVSPQKRFVGTMQRWVQRLEKGWGALLRQTIFTSTGVVKEQEKARGGGEIVPRPWGNKKIFSLLTPTTLCIRPPPQNWGIGGPGAKKSDCGCRVP